MVSDKLTYLRGFKNELESEARDYAGALPRDSINPQKCNFNLFTEQLSGSAFTAPRGSNYRSWLYRISPSVCHLPFKPVASNKYSLFRVDNGRVDPNQKRWRPFKCNSLESGAKIDFVEGIRTLAYSNANDNGSAIRIYIYMASCSMNNKCFYNSDGDFLIVPQVGQLLVRTEFGRLLVEPNEIVVIQQGMKFSIDCEDTFFRGYILEVKGNHFELPNLGPIGANGLANPRDFQVPTAYVEQNSSLANEFKVMLKFNDELFEATQTRSPYDVAAWFGNYTPYKYNLDRFVSVNSVSIDHPDPSIFTVLTCPSIGKPGTALADFVIFPPRWECAKDTFRPPYYHRNCMSEFMGLIKGQYQAKSAAFAPGGGSLHQSMMPHGPDEQCFKLATEQDTSIPKRVADDTMAFMFETSHTLKLTNWALNENVDHDYYKCWQNLAKLTL